MSSSENHSHPEELSSKQCACLSLSLLIGFIGFIAIGALIGNKISEGQKGFTMTGGVLGLGAFMLFILALGAGTKRSPISPSPTNTNIRDTSAVAVIILTDQRAPASNLSNHKSLSSSASTALLSS